MANKVYAIVVTYNGLKWVDSCFSSLIRSTAKPLIITIDNASGDATVNTIRSKYPMVQVIESGKNLGFGQANNIAIRKAYDDGADYVFLLNQDAWVEPETIEFLVNAHKREPEYGVISPVHMNGKGDGLDNFFSLYIVPGCCPGLYSDKWVNKLKNGVYETQFVNAAAWLISRSCIENVGGFNPSFFHYAEDNNYAHRCHYHGFKIGVYPHARIYHDREERTNATTKTDSRVALERRVKLLLCNPSVKGSRIVFKMGVKIFTKSVLTFHPKKIIAAFGDIHLLNRLRGHCHTTLNNSKKKGGLTFL